MDTNCCIYWCYYFDHRWCFFFIITFDIMRDTIMLIKAFNFCLRLTYNRCWVDRYFAVVFVHITCLHWKRKTPTEDEKKSKSLKMFLDGVGHLRLRQIGSMFSVRFIFKTYLPGRKLNSFITLMFKINNTNKRKVI